MKEGLAARASAAMWVYADDGREEGLAARASAAMWVYADEGRSSSKDQCGHVGLC